MLEQLASLSIRRPLALIALVPVVFFTCFSFFRFRSLSSVFELTDRHSGVKFFCKKSFRALALSCFICAYAGISWGSRTVPVQKRGCAVSFVFDISYSMMAKDEGGRTRLEAASEYAEALLDRMEGLSVSVVLAKGDGVLAVPLTDDFSAARSLIHTLHPSLMTAKGSSPGKGLEVAVSSFPSQSSEAPYIWLFTDGEETDAALASALAKAVSSGISVSIIGFGSDDGTDVLAGGAGEAVHSRLRSESLSGLSASLPLKGYVSYVRAAETSSAAGLLKALKLSGNASEERLSYEVQGVERYNFFLWLGIILLLCSYVFGELSLSAQKKSLAALLRFSAVCLSLTGCSGSFPDRMQLLSGSLEWNRKEYPDATADFLSVLDSARDRGDGVTEQYALFDLATTYLVQGENEAARERFEELSGELSDDVRFALLYNLGILAHRNGNYVLAADFFKQALLIDGSSVDAKVNLELSLVDEGGHSGEGAVQPVMESRHEGALENAVYSIIRDQEEGQWKNMRKEETVSDAQDY